VTQKPRVWTVFAAYFAAFYASATASFVILAIAAAYAVPSSRLTTVSDPKAFGELIKVISMTPWVLLASAACSALALGGIALGAARLSPTVLVERMRLGRARGDRRRFAVPPLTAVAALGAGGAAIGTLELVFGNQSEALLGLQKAVRSSGAMLFFTFVIVAVAAPIGEELFFRGYAQTRLVERFGRRVGIVSATALFALLHLDPMHVAGTFAIGAVLAWVTERTGSVRAAIFAHAVNNGLFVLSAQTTHAPTTWAAVIGAGVAGLVALAGIAVLTRTTSLAVGKQQA
jgi:membrane protease YdiL (CAAX protease family)